jgi:hypothetical protein
MGSYGSGGDPVSLGRQMAADRGWTGAEWDALYTLWQQESSWNPYAVNPSSGAYGIPQALPDAQGHPYELGDAAGQIAWGLNYISGRYGDPIAAEDHELAYGWYGQGGFHGLRSYDRGGMLEPGVTIAWNGTGTPEPVVPTASPVSAGLTQQDVDRIGRAIVAALTDQPTQLHASLSIDGRPLQEVVSRAVYKRGKSRQGMR